MNRHHLKYSLTNTSTTMPVAASFEKKLRMVFDNHFLPLATSCQHSAAIGIFFVDEPEIENYIGVIDEGGFDLLGVYLSRCGDSAHIIVCPKKVMDAAKNYHAKSATRMLLSDLYETFLVAVIIHEIGHSLMDECSTTTSDVDTPFEEDDRKSDTTEPSESHGVAATIVISPPAAVTTRPYWRKTIEESLCEAFVLTQAFSQDELSIIRLFIADSPAPYAAGLFWSLAASGARGSLIRTMISWREYKFVAAKLQHDRQKNPWSNQTGPAKVAAHLNKKKELPIPVDFNLEDPLTTKKTEREPVKPEQKKWLDEMGVTDYYAGAGDTIDVDGNVDIAGRNLTKLGVDVKFGLIGGDFDCSDNQFQTFVGFPTEVYGSVICCKNSINSLVNKRRDELNLVAEKWHGRFCLHANEIVQGGIDVVQIDRLVAVDTAVPAFGIIRKYLGRPADIFECQAELLENGFDDFAQL